MTAGWMDEDHMGLLKKFARRVDSRKFGAGVLKMAGYRLLGLKYRMAWLNVEAKKRKQ